MEGITQQDTYMEHHEGDQEVSHVVDESLCLEEVHVRPELAKLFPPRFCKIFRVEPTLKSVMKARVNPLHSPSKAFARNPKLNISFAVNSVFRVLQTNMDGSFDFATAWLVSPLIPFSQGTSMFLGVSAGHTFMKSQKGKNAASYRGCFGRPIDRDIFVHMGFNIEAKPLYIVKDDDADLAIICFLITDEDKAVALPDTVTFLLPCSPSDYGNEGLAAFGYPGVTGFLRNAEEELLLNLNVANECSLWKKYDGIFASKVDLYNAIKGTLRGISSGDLCCSPTRVLETTGNCAKIRSSTVPGTSGSPLLSNMVEGVTSHVFRGTDGVGFKVVNLATGLDHEGFVHAYGEFVLPFIPTEMPGRSTAPFKAWCSRHNLVWPKSVSGLECELTPTK